MLASRGADRPMSCQKQASAACTVAVLCPLLSPSDAASFPQQEIFHNEFLLHGERSTASAARCLAINRLRAGIDPDEGW